VSSGSEKRNCPGVGHIGNNLVTLYMTFRRALQIAVEIMLAAAFRQGLPPDERNHNLKYFIQILPAFLQ